MPYTIRIRRDTNANWAGVVLATGEIGYDSTNNQIKVGDGTTVWGSLGAIGGGGGNIATDTIWDAKGDLVVGSGANTAAKFVLGTNNQVLMVDTSATYGIKWASLSSVYQPLDATLTALAAVTVSSDQLIYATAADTFTTTSFTSFGRSLVDDVDAAAARTTIGLGTIATQNANAVTITGGSLTDVTVGTGTYSSPVNQAILIKARKSTAGTITKGQIVYIVGSSGSHMTVELARADVEATSAYTIGVAATDITNTSDGFIMQQGRLTGLSTLPTSTYANGDTIYLSESTAGDYRKTLPTAPNHGVFIGFVINASNGSAGELDVRVQNYQELEELSDVYISGVAADNFLKRNSGNTRWENVTLATVKTALGLTGTNSGDQTITLTGDVTGSGTGSFATTLATVSIAKGGTGQTTATAAFDALAPTTTAGDIIYYNGTDNIRLGIGTADQVLTVNSGATAPEWKTSSGGTAVQDYIIFSYGIL